MTDAPRPEIQLRHRVRRRRRRRLRRAAAEARLSPPTRSSRSAARPMPRASARRWPPSPRQAADGAGRRSPRPAARRCRSLAEVAHEHRVGSASLALACARGIAGAALERFPEAPGAGRPRQPWRREIEAAPRLVVDRARRRSAERLQARARRGRRNRSAIAGAIQVKPTPSFAAARLHPRLRRRPAAFDPEAAAARVTAALEAALAAEGLHAEPLIPGCES